MMPDFQIKPPFKFTLPSLQPQKTPNLEETIIGQITDGIPERGFGATLDLQQVFLNGFLQSVPAKPHIPRARPKERLQRCFKYLLCL